MQLTCGWCGIEISEPPSRDKNYFAICPNSNCHGLILFDSKKKAIDGIKEVEPNPEPIFFFSHSLRESDREINDIFRKILLSLYINFYEVERDIRSKDKVEKARKGINKSDCVFILMPKRYLCYDKDDEKREQSWRSSEWIQNEVGMAYSFDRDIIAMVERGVNNDGMLQDLTWCYNFDREKLQIPWIEDNSKRTPEETKYTFIDILEEVNLLSK